MLGYLKNSELFFSKSRPTMDNQLLEDSIEI